LVDKAKKEGSLTIYGTMDTPDFENVIKPAFLKLYPWAKVTYLGIAGGEATTKIASEYKAGKVICDVFWGLGYPNHYLLYKEGAITPFVDNNTMIDLMAYPEGFKDPKRVSQPTYQFPLCIGYNTLLVTEAEAPKNYEDLADPKWKGKIAFDRPSILMASGFLFAELSPLWGEERWTTIMKGIAANDPILTETVADAFQKILAGEAAVGIVVCNDYISAKEKGIEVIEINYPKPITIGVTINLAICTNAPHPMMAMLFTQWITSADGQYAIARTGRPPMHTAIAATTILAVKPPPADVTITIPPNPDFFENPEKYSTELKEIFG